MRILLPLFLISTYAVAQKQDTLYVECVTGKTDKEYAVLEKVFEKDFFGKKNVWVFKKDYSGSDLNLVYDARKHQKERITKEYYLHLPIINRGTPISQSMDEPVINSKGDTIYIYNEVYNEISNHRNAKSYMWSAASKDTTLVSVQPPPISYYYEISSFKVYVIEVNHNGTYLKYETNWIYYDAEE